jgi:hypothetical protein
MGRGPTGWRIPAGLYYRTVAEVIRRASSTHGPPPRADFDTKLVRGVRRVATPRRAGVT